MLLIKFVRGQRGLEVEEEVRRGKVVCTSRG